MTVNVTSVNDAPMGTNNAVTTLEALNLRIGRLVPFANELLRTYNIA